MGKKSVTNMTNMTKEEMLATLRRSVEILTGAEFGPEQNYLACTAIGALVRVIRVMESMTEVNGYWIKNEDRESLAKALAEIDTTK